MTTRTGRATCSSAPPGGSWTKGSSASRIARADVYLTNAVKHFRYRERGKRRIHQRPDRWQVNACLPWLNAELDVVRPEALVLLGAVAAQALLGSQVRIGRDRGRPLDSDLAELVMITTHPSAILRAGEAGDRRRAMDAFVSDLEAAASWLSAR